jgi:hypothetical protein
MGLSLCSGCEVSKWRLNWFGLILSEANILRHKTLRSLFLNHRSTGETEGEICLIIFSCLGLVVEAFGVDSSSALRLPGSTFTNFSMIC